MKRVLIKDGEYTLSFTEYIKSELVGKHIENQIEYLAVVLGRFLEGASDLISDDELKDYLGIRYNYSKEIVSVTASE